MVGRGAQVSRLRPKSLRDGVLILYANIFAAHAFYQLIALVPAFVLMSIITLGAFVLAVRLDAQVVAVLGLVGGFITPVLISAGDNAAALFTYIALLNAGIAAIAIHRRWDYLVLLAAVGTVATEFGWAFLRIGHPAAPIAFVVFIGFQLQFLAFFVRALRSAAQNRWFAWSATAVGFAAIVWGFCFLDYGDIRHQPPFLFSYVFLADAALLALAFLNDRDSRLAGFAGSAVFAFLATWTANYLTERNLWWALGAYVLFALLHAIFAVWPREASTRPKNAWIAESVPLLPLALICLCVVQGNTSFAIWFCVLLLDVVLITLAIVRSSTRTMILALIATLVAAALWIVATPRAEDLRAFLVVTGGFGLFFFCAALFAARRFSGHNVELRRNLPALAAGLPFVLLIMAVAKLPILNPTPVFTVAFLLAVLLLGIGIFSRTSWIAAVALGFTWVLQSEWHTLHFAHAQAGVAFAWALVFLFLFVGYPFFTAAERTQIPWAIGALAGPFQFWLIYELVTSDFPGLRNGLLPAAFIVPFAFGAYYLARHRGADPAQGDARLAWQGGAALFFVSLVFPIQFDREWITLGWAVEGLALLWLFRRVPHHGLRAVGAALLCIAFARLALNPAVLEYHRRAPIHLWNWYLYAYGITIGCLLLAARLFTPPPKWRWETIAPAFFYSLGTILTFLLLNIEIADYFSIGPTLTFSFSGDFARDMTYSIAWALFAFGLLIVGMRKQARALRYAGLALLIVTLLKLFLHDLGNLNQLYRIGAFIGVALILIVASFVYQRFLSPAAETPPAPPSTAN